MANIFAIVLAITTFITGILWCLEHIKIAPTIRRLLMLSNEHRQGTITENSIVIGTNYKLKWIKTYASIFPTLLLVFIMRSFIFEPFQIPSGSMMPTLLVGDFILVNKFAYGIKDPFTHTTLIKIGHPKRGDVVVFKYPLNPSLDYIKRVVGLPGDRVSYDPISKRITVQPGYINDQDCSIVLPITYSDITLSDFVQIFNLTSNGETSSSFLNILPHWQVGNNCIRLVQCKELLGDVLHNILTIPIQQDQVEIYYQQSGKSLAEWIVPQGEYFMMGDNRDNSADSRYWGFVPEKNLVGKATTIWMSFDKQEGQWPTGVRLNRIGEIH